MTDGIRRTNISTNVPIDTNTNQVENDAKVEVNSTNSPALGYSNVRDSYEVTKSVINQNTTPPSSDALPKIDADASNLLNQQLLSARLGTPLFKQPKIPDAKLNQLSANLEDLKAEKMGLTQQIINASNRVDGKQEATGVQAEKARQAQNGTLTSENPPPEISTRTRTSELFDSQTFKPIIDDAAKYAQHQERMETERKINEARAQIHDLQDGIKADFEKIDKLERQLAEAQAAYAENPTKELAERIQALSKEIEELKDGIKEKEAEIRKQQDLIKELETGEAPEQNTQQARDIS